MNKQLISSEEKKRREHLLQIKYQTIILHHLAKSKLDNTTVVTFKNQSSNLTGFRQVTTGWRWKNPNADRPFNEYCYLINIDRVRIDLATKDNNIKKSAETGWLTTGPMVKQFESEISEYTGAKYVVAVNSCTAGLHLSCLALGIKKGDATSIAIILLPEGNLEINGSAS